MPVLRGAAVKRKIPEVDIIALWESYGGELVGPDRNGERKAKCALPDHDDNSPSASVNEDEGLWNCYVCGKGGDAIALVREVNGLGFADAISFLEEFAGRGNAAVREQRAGSSLLPRSKGSDSRGGSFVPPWRRL